MKGKKSHNAEKLKGASSGSFSLARYCMLYPNFENVTSELQKRYILNFKKLYPNFENVTLEIENGTSEL